MKKFIVLSLVILSFSLISCPGPHDSVDNNSPLLGTWTQSTFFSIDFENTRNFTMINNPPPNQQAWTARGTYSYTNSTVTFHNAKFDPHSSRFSTWTMDYQIVEEYYYGSFGQVIYLRQGNHELGALRYGRLFKNNN